MTYKITTALSKLIIFLFFIVNYVNASDEFELLIGTVDEQALTSYELNQRIKILINTLQLEDNIGNRDKVRESALEKLIEDKLKISEAKKLEITISDSELDLFLSNIFKFPVEKKIEFSNFLNDQGIDEDIVREQARAELLWNKIINQRFAGFITVSELEINEEKKIYENNIGSMQFNFSEISVNKNESKKNALKKIQQIKQLLDQDTKFSTVASRFSDSPTRLQGGVLGWIFSSQLDNLTRVSLEDMLVGQTSKIIEMENNYKIIKLNNKRIYGQKGNKEYDIINFSSPKNNDNFIKFMNLITDCSQDFKSLEFSEKINFDKIEKIEISDFSNEIQKNLNQKTVGEKTKIFNKNNNQYFFLICNIFGTEIEKIDEKIIENNIYSRKIRQLSRTHLNKIKKIANINIGIE